MEERFDDCDAECIHVGRYHQGIRLRVRETHFLVRKTSGYFGAVWRMSLRSASYDEEFKIVYDLPCCVERIKELGSAFQIPLSPDEEELPEPCRF